MSPVQALLLRALQDPRLVVGAGFGAVLLLMSALIGVSLSAMQQVHGEAEALVHEQALKLSHLNTMRHAARERTIRLHRLALMSDPFDQDAEVNEFQALGNQFLAAREALEQLPLSATERLVLGAYRESTRRGGAIQQRIVQAALAGDLAEANRLLVEESVPEQDHGLAHLDRLIDMQYRYSEAAVAEVLGTYTRVRRVQWGLAVLVLLSGALIAALVLRRTGRIEERLHQEKERAQVTLRSIADGVITTGLRGEVEYLNPAAEQLIGTPLAAARGRPVAEVFAAVREDGAPPALPPAAAPEEVGAQAELRRADGAVLSLEYGSAPIRNHEGRLIGSVLVFRDVTRSRELTRQLTWAAGHDELTGLPNRREFSRRLAELLDQAQRSDAKHALLYLDLDQFKVINDTCGHTAGDELLRQLARVLRGRLRASDTLARLGGDEFGVLLQHTPLRQAREVAEALRALVADFRFNWQGHSFGVGVSVGLIGIDRGWDTAGSILSAADTACYAAKEQGRSRVHVLRRDDKDLSDRQGEMQWVHRIGRALQEDRFRLYFQRIVPLSGAQTGRHYELLLRLVGEDGRLIPPGAFIPAAERYQLMPALDRWVVRAAFAHMRASGMRTGDLCAINLSGQSLGSDGFLEFIAAELARGDVPAACVCFEITETAAVANLVRARQFIATLKGLGCRFALDDFGSGMSSFAYLKNLPVDFLKIDGSFVRAVASDEVDGAMVDAINRIGHVMGLRTIAEFVEDEVAAARLRELGVDFAQGYAVHRPEPLPQQEEGRAAARVS